VVDVGVTVGAGEGIDKKGIAEGLNVGIDDGARVARTTVEDDTEVTFAIAEVTDEANEPLLKYISTLTENSLQGKQDQHNSNYCSSRKLRLKREKRQLV
jgi:hypothetical protein